MSVTSSDSVCGRTLSVPGNAPWWEESPYQTGGAQRAPVRLAVSSASVIAT